MNAKVKKVIQVQSRRVQNLPSLTGLDGVSSIQCCMANLERENRERSINKQISPTVNTKPEE